MLGYGFPSLTPEQLALRRQQLDNAGFYGWLLSVTVVLILATVRLLTRTFVSSKSRKASTKQVTASTALYRRIAWILNTTLVPEFGPLHVQLLGVGYLLCLLFVIFRNTGNDYMHLTKAFGHVAISQLPLHYLLAMKSPKSPITLATGLTHERLNSYHRLFGRMIHGLLGAHAVLYIRFFLLKNLMAKRIQDWDVRLGLMAFWLFNILGVFALPPIRKKAYHKLFYRSHVVISAVVLPVLFFHVPYTRRYVVQAAIFWVANGVMRRFASRTAVLRCEAIKDTSLIKVVLKGSDGYAINPWVPGEHVYLNSAGLGPKNPFTIVDVAGDEGAQEVRLVVRNVGGAKTASLAANAATGKETMSTLEGPYGESSKYLPALLQQHKSEGEILLVAGGVGATYALPIYLSLLNSRNSTAGIRMIWFVKSYADCGWGLDALKATAQAVSVDIYITQPSHSGTTPIPDVQGITINEIGSRPTLSLIFDPLLQAKSTSSSNGSVVGARSSDPRRARQNAEKVTVLACGPPSLMAGLRQEIGKHVMSIGREIAWYEEQFGHGGS